MPQERTHTVPLPDDATVADAAFTAASTATTTTASRAIAQALQVFPAKTKCGSTAMEYVD